MDTNSLGLKSFKNAAYTVGWIAALSVERAAAEAMLDEEHTKPFDFTRPSTDNNSYSWGRIGVHNIVIAALPAGMYGQVPAAAVAKDMVSSFPHIRVGLMVGIGGGLPQPEQNIDIRLGDIVVSEPSGQNGGVAQYDVGKATTAGFELKGFIGAPPMALLNAVTKLKAQHDRLEPKVPAIVQDMLSRYPRMAKGRQGKPSYAYQGQSYDRLFKPGYNHTGELSCDKCEASEEICRYKRETTDPEIHYGIIASGNAVIKDAADRAEVLRRLGTCLCVETEAAGLMNNFPCLVIRGICDYADSHKNDQWQPYAAATAAGYAKELLGVLDKGEIESTKRIEEVLDGINQTIEKLFKGRHSDKINKWLSPVDPSINYNEALQKRHDGTCQWLLRNTKYLDWKEFPSSFLWLNGIPGCGKTVLSSTIIENLKGVPVFYFYFTFTDKTKESLDQAIRSLISQLYHTNFEQSAVRKCLDICFASHNDGNDRPTLETLIKTFHEMVRHAGEVWIVLDALDECPIKNRQRHGLFEWIGRLRSETKNIHLLVTSRPEHDIQLMISQQTTDIGIISLQKELIWEDITAYIKWEVRNRKGLRRWKENAKVQRKIENVLTAKADGMFRWVFCQLETIEDCLNYAAVKKALSCLPDTLDETYERILSNLPRQYMDNAIRLLQFLAFSERPLRIEEAVDALAVSTTEPLGARFDIENRMPEPEEIIKYCGSLVVMITRRMKYRDYDYNKGMEIDTNSDTNGDTDGDMDGDTDSDTDIDITTYPNEIAGYKKVHMIRDVQLAHFSVQTYLLSEQIQHETAKSVRTTGITTIGEVCLAYLLELKYLPKKGLHMLYPFAKFAAKYWTGFAAIVGKDSANLHQLAMDLLNTPDSYHICLNLFQPDPGFYSCPYSSLYFASLCGLSLCARDLLNEGANVNEKEGFYGNALQAASINGHFETAQLLLNSGAEMDVQGLHETALQAASFGGHFEIAQLFLDRGAEINARCRYANALQIASSGGHFEIVQLLLDRGAEINAQRGHYETALQVASSGGHFEIVQLLLDRGAETNAQGGHYGNALQAASSEGHFEIAQLLLDRGADINARGRLYFEIPGNSFYMNDPYIASRNSSEEHFEIDEESHFSNAFATASSEENFEIPGNSFYMNDPYIASRNSSEEHFEIDEESHSRNALATASSEENSEIDEESHSRNALATASSEENSEIEQESYFKNALYAASRRGRLKIAEKRHYGTALYAVSYRGYIEIAQLLLDRGAEVNAPGGHYGNALQAASSEGHFKIVQLLLDRGAETNAQGGHYGNALQAASFRGHFKIAQLLLDRGADINAQGRLYFKIPGNNFFGNDPYTYIASRNSSEEYFEIDEESYFSNAFAIASSEENFEIPGNSVYVNDPYIASRNSSEEHFEIDEESHSRNALATASSEENSEIDEESHSRNALYAASHRLRFKIAQLGHYGNALYAVSHRGHIEIAQLLLDRGAEINAPGGYYGNALGAASSRGHFEIVQLLLDRGAKINAPGGRYGNALGAASSRGHFEIVQLLLDRGAEINAPGGRYGNALGAASSEGHFEIVQLLLDRGADINTPGGYYGNALGAASSEGHFEIAQLLLDRGADINTPGGRYGNALQAASSRGHFKIAQLLVNNISNRIYVGFHHSSTAPSRFASGPMPGITRAYQVWPAVREPRETGDH